MAQNTQLCDVRCTIAAERRNIIPSNSRYETKNLFVSRVHPNSHTNGGHMCDVCYRVPNKIVCHHREFLFQLCFVISCDIRDVHPSLVGLARGGLLFNVVFTTNIPGRRRKLHYDQTHSVHLSLLRIQSMFSMAKLSRFQHRTPTVSITSEHFKSSAIYGGVLNRENYTINRVKFTSSATR